MQHAKDIKQVLFKALVLNMLTCALKLLYGILTGTLSMIADGIHSMTDALASVLGLISLHYAQRPSDENHHYGHQKYETLAALCIGFFIAVSSWEVFKASLKRLTSTKDPSFHSIGIVLLAVGMILSFLLSHYEKRKGKELNSAILQADAAHTMSDVWVSFSVLASLMAIRWQWFWADSVVSLLISGYLAFVAFRLVRENGLILTDAAFIDSQAVKGLVEALPGIQSCHQIRTRGCPGQAFVDLHVEIDPTTDTQAAHQLTHDLEKEIKTRVAGIQEVLVHIEPSPAKTPSGVQR